MFWVATMSRGQEPWRSAASVSVVFHQLNAPLLSMRLSCIDVLQPAPGQVLAAAFCGLSGALEAKLLYTREERGH